MNNVFGIYFWTILMASIVMGGFQARACSDCGMSNHEYYGGK
jgi:hypothetical protein